MACGPLSNESQTELQARLMHIVGKCKHYCTRSKNRARFHSRPRIHSSSFDCQTLANFGYQWAHFTLSGFTLDPHLVSAWAQLGPPVRAGLLNISFHYGVYCGFYCGFSYGFHCYLFHGFVCGFFRGFVRGFDCGFFPALPLEQKTRPRQQNTAETTAKSIDKST